MNQSGELQQEMYSDFRDSLTYDADDQKACCGLLPLFIDDEISAVRKDVVEVWSGAVHAIVVLDARSVNKT